MLNALRVQDASSTLPPAFGLPALDRLLYAANEGRSHTNSTSPILELISLHAGGGATHLLYHLTALAVLPSERGGRQAGVVLLDADGSFDVDRLATQLRMLLKSDATAEDEAFSDETIFQALRHVHIFRPQSLASLAATLDSLPLYLFNQQRHFSFDRAVGFIAIDSASAFYWQDRAETEDAAFFAKTSGDPGDTLPQSGYAALTAALKQACATLQCPAIFTSWHLGPLSTAPHAARSFRPPLPAPFSGLPALRLACQRVPVRKFPPMISFEGAKREAEDRMKAVEEAKFECFVNEWGVDERTLRRMREVGGGFGFNVREEGLTVASAK